MLCILTYHNLHLGKWVNSITDLRSKWNEIIFHVAYSIILAFLLQEVFGTLSNPVSWSVHS